MEEPLGTCSSQRTKCPLTLYFVVADVISPEAPTKILHVTCSASSLQSIQTRIMRTPLPTRSSFPPSQMNGIMIAIYCPTAMNIILTICLLKQ